MSKSLFARVEALEAARSDRDLPNGGIVCIALEDGEASEEARERVMASPWVAALSVRQRAKLCLLFLNAADQAV